MDSLSEWCTVNELHLNIGKCQVIRFTRVKKTIIYDYVIDGQKLKAVKVIRGLGILFDDRLTFVEHIDNIVGRAMKMLGFVLRTVGNFDSLTCFKILYTTLVRSILENNSSVWSPYYKIHSIIVSVYSTSCMFC